MYYTNPPLSDVEVSKYPLVPIYIDQDKKKFGIEKEILKEKKYI